LFIDKEKIEKLIDKLGVAFISSIDNDGFPNTKAMLPARKREELKAFYFSTNTSSMRVGQYRENPKACIYFCSKGRFRYQGVMLIGTMEILEDAESKEMIWQTGDTMYYPKGVTDPDYCVLKFTAHSGRYYENLGTESFSM
jgi:general stress protein 26